MRMSLHPDLSEISPGDEVELQITLANDATTEVTPIIDVQGLDADLWALANPMPVIAPGAVGRASLRVRLPDDSPPGDRTVAVTARAPGTDAGASAVTVLRVGTNYSLSVETDPSSVTGRSGGRLNTVVRNLGDEDLDVTMSGRSEGAEVEMRPATFTLPAGTGARLGAVITPLKRSWFSERRHGVVIEARSGSVPSSTTAMFVQRPTVPPLLLRITAVVLALAVWASVSFVLFDRISGDPEVAAPVDTVVDSGDAGPPADVVLAGAATDEEDAGVTPPVVIAGTVEGPRDPSGSSVLVERVSFGDEGTTGGSTGKIAAGTPVAFSSGTVLEKISATTDEGGRFRVGSGLIADAFYRVTVSRAGFDLTSQVVTTGGGNTEIDLAITLVPGRGQMTGRVTDLAGTPLGGAEIVATQGTVTYRTTTASEGEGAGTWQIDGLATPATYLVTIIADGHASQQLTVEVGGGAAVSGVDATMERDRGTIRGAITYRDAGVGAVTVALEGDVSRTTTTLTVGDVAGSFDFPNLPYGTYLLTFSKDGWLTQSREVTVSTGDVAIDVRDLLPSTAIIQGAVSQQVTSGSCSYPDPTAGDMELAVGSCGGVGVSVIGETGTWRTTTATGDGSFRLSGIPAGEYTVEFERYGYLPEFYRVIVGPGDTLTLPDDATYDVEMAAYRGPSNRSLQPLDDSSIALRLVPATPLNAGRVTGIIRSVLDVETPFDEAFGDGGWSGSCDSGIAQVAVIGQPGLSCELVDGGGFVLEGVAPGAVDLTVDSPGFGTTTTTVQVSPTEETQAGLIALTPLATLSLNVAGAGDLPASGVVAFVAPTTDDVPTFDGSDGVGECTVARLSDDVMWKQVIEVPDSASSLTGLCVTVDGSGDAVFARALGTGTYDVILPVNAEDPTDEATLAGTVPLDHVQLQRTIDVQQGENARLDLRLRRYAVIFGSIQEPNATTGAYDNITPDNLPELEAFPSLDTDGEFGTAGNGIRFCQVWGSDAPDGTDENDCRPFDDPDAQPRLSIGEDAGLPDGLFRIDRVLADAGDVRRSYLFEVVTESGRFIRSPALNAAIDGLSYGFDRSVSAVVSPTAAPARLNFVWSKAGTYVPVPEAQVTVSGTSDFRSLEVPPYRESVEVVCPSAACNSTARGEDDRLFVISPSVSASAEFMTTPSTGDDTGSISFDNVFRTGTLTVSAERTGFDTLNQTVALASARGDGARVVMVPTPRPVSGTFFVEPAASTELLNGMTMTLTPVQGGSSLTATATAVNSSSPAAGATVSFAEVPPGVYDIVVAGDGLVTTELGELDIDPESTVREFDLNGYFDDDPALDLAARTIEAEKILVVSVVEDPPGGVSTAAVPNVRVRLFDADSALVGIVNTCAASEDNGGAVGCEAAGEARFTGLGEGTYTVRAAAPSGDGYITSSDVTVSVTNGAVDDNGDPTVVTETDVTVVRFGAISGRALGRIDAGSSGTSLAGASVTLYEVAGGLRSTEVASTTSGSDGSYSFPATVEIPAGSYEIGITLEGYTEVSVSVAVAAGTETSVATSSTTLTANPADVTGQLTDSTTSLALPFVRVQVFGSSSCADPGSSSTAPADVAGDDCAWTIDDADPTLDGTLPVDGSGLGTFTLPPRPVTLEFAEFAWDGSAWSRTERPVLERSFTPVAGGSLDVTTTIAPAVGSLSGTVNLRNYDGAAVSSGAGASVAIYVLDDDGDPTGSPIAGPVTAGTGGSYSFASLAVGNYGLVAQNAGYTDSAVQTISVVAGGAVTVPAVTLTATPRSVTVSVVSGDDGASALGNLSLEATPPIAGVSLTTQSAVTNTSGEATFTLAPGVWSIASTDGATASLQVGGAGVAQHLDASAVTLTVPAGTGSFDHTVDSGSPLISFVKVSGTITGADYVGASGAALTGADVSIAGTDLAVSAAGAWSAFVPTSSTARNLSVAATATGYDTGTATVSVASSAVTGADIELIAASKTVTVRVSSGTNDADLDGLSLRATQRNGVTVTPITASVTTSDGSNDGERVYTFVGLSPGKWTIETTGGAVLSTAHLDVAAADGVRVTVGTTDIDLSDPIIDFIELTGTVYELPYAVGTPAALNGATVSVDSDTSVSSVSSGSGTWKVRIPERATARSVAVTATSGSHASSSGTFTVPAAGDNASNDPVMGSGLNLVATPRNVTVRATSGGSGFPLEGLNLVATPPGGSGLSTVTANSVTGEQGFATFSNLAPTTWTISSTNGADGTLQVDGVDVAEHLDASGVTLEVPVGTGAYNHFTSTNNSLLQFVTISGTVSALNEAGTASSPLGGAVVAANTDGDVTATTDSSGNWYIRVLSGSSGLQFDVTATNYITSSITGVSTANPSGRNVTLTPTSAAVSATFSVVSASDSSTAVTGVSLTLTPSIGSAVTASDDDNDGEITVSGLEVKDYVVTVVDANGDGVADGATDHLATGPLSPITGEDTGSGPRSFSVSSSLGTQTIELAKLDTSVTGTIGTASDAALAALNGATVTLTSTVGPRVSYSATLTGNDVSAESLAVASDRPWTVTVSKTSYADATRSIATGGSGALGRVTLASATRTVSGALTGPAGATVTITASARGYADATSTTQVAIDTGTVSYALAGLSTDVTWRLDFSVTEAGTTTTVSRWVANGAGDVTLNQAVGTTAVASITVVVADITDAGVRTGPIDVTVTLTEATTIKTIGATGSSGPTGEVSATVTLVKGVTSGAHTFANLVQPGAGTTVDSGRFTVSLSATNYVATAVDDITNIDPTDQTVLVEIEPAARDVAVTLTAGGAALSGASPSLVKGDVTASVTSVDNVYRFANADLRPGNWTLTVPGYATQTIAVPIGSGTYSATVDLTAVTGAQLAVTTQPVGDKSGAVLATQPVVEVRSADGSTATLDDATVVRAAISSGAEGTLRGTTSAVANDGVATFGNLRLDGVAGTDYVLTFTADGLPPVQSAPVQVTAGAPTDAVITLGATGVDTDAAATTSVSATLVDSGGNAAAPTGTVAITQAGVSLTTAESSGTYSATTTATGTAGAITIAVTHDGDVLGGAVSLLTSPGAPGSLAASAGNGVVHLVWAPPASDGGAAITDYVVEVNTGPGYITVAEGTSSATNARVPGLANGTAATFRVSATNSVGTGVASATASATPSASATAPVITAVTPGNGQATVAYVLDDDGGVTVDDIKVQVDGGTWTALGSTNSPLTVTGLTNGTAHVLRLRPVDASDAVTGDASTAITVTPRTTPGAPTSLTVAARDGELSVGFTAPTSNGGASITNYEYSLDSGSNWVALSPVDVSSPITITGLTNGVAQTGIQLRAVNAAGAGTASAGTASGTPTTNPTAPVVSSVTPGDGDVDVVVAAPTLYGQSVSRYEYQIDGGAWMDTGGTATSFTIGSLTNGTTYLVRVRAVTAAGNGEASGGFTAMPYATPAAPTSVSASATNGGASIEFTAADSGGPAIRNYEYRLGSGSWTPISPNTTSSPLTIYGLTNGTVYSITIRAVTDLANGTASEAVTVTPVTVASAPQAAAVSPGDNQVVVSWSAPADDGGSTVVSYTVQYRSSTATEWTVVTGVSASPTTVGSLTDGLEYLFRVAAVNGPGTGAYSAAVAAVPGATPGAPTITGAVAGDGDAEVSFNAGDANGATITNYQFSVDGGTSWTALNPVDTSSPVTVTGLANGTAYTVKLRAVTTVGTGTASAASSSFTPTGEPGAPTGLAVSSSDGDAALTWTAPSATGGADITDYIVQYRATTTTTWSTFSDGTGTSVTATVTGLDSAIDYAFRVAAVNSEGTGDYSGEVVLVAVSSASLSQSTVSAADSLIDDSGSTTVTVQLVDSRGRNLTASSGAVAISADNSATVGSVTDNGDGTYSATVTATTAGTITVSATLNGVAISNTATIEADGS